MNVFELMLEYINEGRIKIDRDKFRGKLATVHDPCNYVRKAEKTFGKGYGGEIREILDAICTDWVDTHPTDQNNFCCGAGGGAWAMPYTKERLQYGGKKADQIKESKAEIVVAPCHNCRDQIMKALTKEYNLEVETFYLWELLSEALVIEPWSEEEQAAANELAQAQWDALGIEAEDDDDDWVPPQG
jgi:Fe-S oxidoreductase